MLAVRIMLVHITNPQYKRKNTNPITNFLFLKAERKQQSIRRVEKRETAHKELKSLRKKDNVCQGESKPIINIPKRPIMI
jgi:hypothetical protein